MELNFPTDLSKLIDLARKKGVSSFKIDAGSALFECTLAPEEPLSRYKKKQADTTGPDAPADPDPVQSQEAALFWSSPGIPDGQE